jgi:hypothetical protein
MNFYFFIFLWLCFCDEGATWLCSKLKLVNRDCLLIAMDFNKLSIDLNI